MTYKILATEANAVKRTEDVENVLRGLQRIIADDDVFRVEEIIQIKNIYAVAVQAYSEVAFRHIFDIVFSKNYHEFASIGEFFDECVLKW